MAGDNAAAIADSFDELVRVSDRFEREFRELAASQAPLSEATVDQLSRLLESMRPAAATRRRLAALSPEALQAGVRLWLHRQGIEPIRTAAGRALRTVQSS